MIEITCKHCSKVFKDYPSINRVFCSRPCADAGNRGGLTHGKSRTRLHATWCSMKSRCSSATSPLAKKYYQEKGIKVCEEWQSFEAFESWATSNGYSDDLEIDRKDAGLGYSPDNCRWANRNQQMANKKKANRANATSRYKGVQRLARKNGKCVWRAVISINRKPKHLGVFLTEEEAARQYDVHAVQMYGEFASLNFEKEFNHTCT
jgi:hypothetical protein